MDAPISQLRSASQQRTNFDVEEDSSTIKPSCSTAGNTNIPKIMVHISQKQVCETLAGADQSSADSTVPEYTPEQATKILQWYGLEKEDLEDLLHYPEDEVTAMNLPVILQQLSNLKRKKMAAESGFLSIKSSTGPEDMRCPESPQTLQIKTPSTIEPDKDRNFGLEWKPLHDQNSSVSILCPIRTSVEPPICDSNKWQSQPCQGLQTFLLLPCLTKSSDGRSANSKESELLPLKEQKANLSPQIQPSGSDITVQADPMVKNRICRKSKTHRKVLKAVEKKKKEKCLKKKSKQQTSREPDQILGLRTSDPLPVRSGMVSDSPILPLEAFNPVISSQRFQPASDGWFLPVSSSLPPRAMMDDYAAATPRLFPHTCSLCSQVCSNIQDWIFHQNISFHLENCKLLRKRYPNWDCTVPLFKSIRPGSRSRPRNESQSGHSSVEDGWDRPRSRSRSPSPYCSDVFGAGWRSGEDLNGQRSRSPSTSHNGSCLRSHERESSSRKRKEMRSSSGRRHQRRSSTMVRSSNRLRLSKVEKLTERLLKKSAVQSLMKKPKLKAVIKTLVPLILTELKNMKSSSSSFPSHKTKRRLNAKLSKVKPEHQFRKPQAAESSPPSSVVPRETLHSLPDSDVVSAVEKSAGTKSGRLLKSKRKATVCFENEEAEEKVKKMKSIDIEETSVTVFTEKNEAIRKQFPAKQKITPQPVSLDRSVFKQQSTEPCETMVLHPSSKLPESATLMFAANRADVGDSEQQMHPDKTQRDADESPKTLEEKSMGDTRLKPKSQLGCLQEEEEVSRELLLKVSERNQVAFMNLKAENLEIQLQESSPVAETLKTTHERKQQAELEEINLWAKQLKDAESQKYLETRAADPVEVKTTNEVDLQENLPTKLSECSALNSPVFTSKPTDLQTTINLETPTAPVRSSSQNQKPDALEKLQKPGSSSLLKKSQKFRDTKTKAKKKVKTREQSPAAACIPMVEETFEELQVDHLIGCLSRKTVMSPKLFSLDAKLLMITKLPKYYDGCYRESDVADLFCPFGFLYKGNNIYVIPQKRMAFVLMPDVTNVRKIITYLDENQIVFKGSSISVRVVHDMVSMKPFGFYTFLIKKTRSGQKTERGRVIFIHNICQSEIRALKEALIKIGSVKRYLPLLEKVFVEFESRHEADLLGVWYSFLRDSPPYYVFRMIIPESSSVSPPPAAAERALPDGHAAVDGAAIPTAKCGVPQGSAPPFWITMSTNPCVFPTFAPWFNIPDYLTVETMESVEKVAIQASRFSTVMLTGLPQKNYTHQDVAKLVWHFFPKPNLHTWFYNVTVLPLQRRAFVFFSSWSACRGFVKHHIRKPVSVRGCKLSVHLVLEDMQPGFTEETMYRALMKWSNAHVSDAASLEERLLCVENSQPSPHLAMLVMKEVASVAAFVNFLPLANRIMVEMAEPSGVTEAVHKVSLGASSTHQIWSQVKRIEPLRSLNQRLQDSTDTEISLEVNTNMAAAPLSVKPAAGWSIFWPQQGGSRTSQDSFSAKRRCSSAAAAKTLLFDREDGKPESITVSSSGTKQKTESQKPCSAKKRKQELRNQSLKTSVGAAAVRYEGGQSVEEEIYRTEPVQEDEGSLTPRAENDPINHHEGPLVSGGIGNLAGDQPVTETEVQKLETPSNLLTEAGEEPSRGVYRVMDSGEDQTPTDRESETNEEKPTGDDGPTRSYTSGREGIERNTDTDEEMEADEHGSTRGRTTEGDVWNQEKKPSGEDEEQQREEKTPLEEIHPAEKGDSTTDVRIKRNLQELHSLDESEGCEEQEKLEACNQWVGSLQKESPRSAAGRGRRSVSSEPSRGLDELKTVPLQSSSVSLSFKLFPSSCRPLFGEEFVEPRLGRFCSVCSVFYLGGTTADDSHCSSRAHYDRLKNYYQKLSTTESIDLNYQTSASD